MITGIVIVGVLALLALIGFAMYNGLIKTRNYVEEAWSQIDVQLKRRADLIPNLVNTVKGYAKHEADTLGDVTEARAAIAKSSSQNTAGAIEASGIMEQMVGRLFAVAEAYPDLKASQNFLSLQEDLASTENKVSAARQHYNVSVRQLNTKIQTVPTNIIAKVASINEREYFELPEGHEDREVVEVKF